MSSQNQPTPPSSTSSNGASPENQQFRVVRKRNRIPLSCAPCRHRKLKCNRAHPCDNCTKRGDVASCNYATTGTRKKGGAAGANSSPEDMQNRIDRLEGLVLSLMTTPTQQSSSAAAAQAAINGSRSNSLSTGSDFRIDVDNNDIIPEEIDGEDDESDVDQMSRGLGVMKMDNGKTVFASDSHWYAILNEISEVKRYFECHKEDYRRHFSKVKEARGEENTSGTYLFQGLPPTTRQDLLDAFPSKSDADRLIARYFNAYDPSHHILHGPTFQKQYDKHWLNPQDTCVMWIGMCFAMMTLALQSYHRAGDEPPEYRGRALQLSHHYRRLTAQCLLLSDLTQPIAMILETLILHLQAEYGRSKDAEPGVLLIMSLCVRLAMRMGYHRDPGPHPGITPFQGELRRRVFTFVRQCDLLFSFQFGITPMIRSDQVDSLPPRNLYDDELDEDMVELPPSRPSFEATPMSYMLAKSKMTNIFGRIVERVSSLTEPPSYEETMRFDRTLRDARAAHPPLLQMRPFAESARDPANLIMQRIGLEMVYLRSLFVLHRRFIARGRDNQRYAYSRHTCIDASLQLLAHQSTLHQESQPGGRLRSVKWYISSLATHDFLLAAMLVCLDLYYQNEAEKRGRRSLSPSSSSPIGDGPGSNEAVEHSREEMLAAVEHCITIWDAVRNHSMEAYKASSALRVMVDKLKAAHPNLPAPNGNSSAAATTSATATTVAAAAAASSTPGSSSTTSAAGTQLGIPGSIQQTMWQSHSQRPKGAAALDSHMSFMFDGRAGFGAFPNNSPSEMVTDQSDLAESEQTAAMTLGLLSSGGGGVMSPNGGTSFGTNGNNNANGNAGAATGSAAERSAGFPAGMMGLLNDPLPERTGLTPGYSGDGASGMPGAGPASPFSTNLFGQQAGNMVGVESMGMGLMGGDIDWGAWDNYIANNSAMDPASSMWPMNLDFGSLEDALPGATAAGAGAGGGVGTSPDGSAGQPASAGANDQTAATNNNGFAQSG